MAMEGILVNGVLEVLTKMVIPVVVSQKAGFTWSLKDDLKKLQDNLEMIRAILADAEEKKEQSNLLRLWLKRLNDVAYDAGDILDDFYFETMHRAERDSFKCKALDFVSSSNPIAYHLKLTKQIKEINKRVDEIAKDMERFQLETSFNSADGESSWLRSRQTASFLFDSEIVGRKDDKNKIVDMLTKATSSSSSSSSSSEKVPAISVVGMGGLGKTTLAQLAYNDELVIKHFDQRMWVCVSTDFHVEKILIKMMESITLAKFEKLSNFDVLVNKVRENLRGKKFLLVLDDLWNEDVDQWEMLKIPLIVGAPGSKILITTRNMQVADIVKGSYSPYLLEKLQEDECWSIMEKRAFSPGGAVRITTMTSIGKEIAKQCCGLPLAAKFLGSLMHSKNKERDWLSIKEAGLWNTQEGQCEIRPILKLSYDNLSPRLKHCFSYCSLFPKGWEIRKETLIHMWMAEGFLELSSFNGYERPVEEIGEECFDSLVWSSFLDGVEKNDLDDIITCKMHDLVHDLGRDVGNREYTISDEELSRKCSGEPKTVRTCIVVEPNDNVLFPFSLGKLRVLHYGRADVKGCREILNLAIGKTHLRYFFLHNMDLIGMKMHDGHSSISTLYSLQTLVLSRFASVQILLQNMGSLKNLRFLDISSSDIKELPDSVSSLFNLQRLNLSHCRSFATFPNSVSGLQHLKFLDMSFTPIEELPGSIVNLRSLQTLDVSSCEKLQSIPEYVTSLASLRIFNFRNCPLLEALPEDFGSLTQLRSLDLEHTAIKVLPDSCSNLFNLEYVDLWRCQLPNEVTNWSKLRKFYYKGKGRTPIGIGELGLLRMLTYRVREEVITDPERNEAGIEELANLNYLENLFFFGLEKVHDPINAERANLKEKQKLRVLQLQWNEIEEADEEEWIKIEELGIIISSTYLNNFQVLQAHFQVFQALQPPPSLNRLDIYNFMGFNLPTWMSDPSCLPNLETLLLENCKDIVQLTAGIGQLPRLRLLKLSRLPLESLDIGEFPSLIALYLEDMPLLEELGRYHRLQDLSISGCRSLTEIPSFPSLTYLLLQNNIRQKLVCSVGRNLTSLTTLYLHNINWLGYFPVSILENNSNLQELQIHGCRQFDGFLSDPGEDDVIALCEPKVYSTSLKILDLKHCPVLKFLPDLRGWTSLQKLAVLNCPQMKEFLTYDLRDLSFLKELGVDFIQRDEKLIDLSQGLMNLMISNVKKEKIVILPTPASNHYS